MIERRVRRSVSSTGCDYGPSVGRCWCRVLLKKNTIPFRPSYRGLPTLDRVVNLNGGHVVKYFFAHENSFKNRKVIGTQCEDANVGRTRQTVDGLRIFLKIEATMHYPGCRQCGDPTVNEPVHAYTDGSSKNNGDQSTIANWMR